ncbi:BON domain-containing protein [Caenimonas aquaedulcis]|uniref:BON domain-containing protein n=1 Tax=Caenimonas aquaedulcis TaxID=2793270 RepID=A0A931H4T1_9BURK|nr:BON domain-containing protein [Caenimonas aquaedulcis]MBG9388645.1 BON domain-containing protein [Caenimonas aquaedulcis]
MNGPFAVAAFLLLMHAAPCGAQERRNFFEDPFAQVTSALRDCPEPEGPLMTPQEFRDAAHIRAQHGGSCYLSGRCRLPNSYLYDKEIIPRTVQYIQRDGRFDDTSVWILGQRRIVTILGCVNSREQADALVKWVMLMDDVMNVVDQTMVGTRGAPPYPVQGR